MIISLPMKIVHFSPAVYCVATGMFMGPRQNSFGEAGGIAVFAKKILNNEQPFINGTCEQIRDFVYVKDFARTNLLAVKSNLIEVVNISTGRKYQ